MPTIQGRITWAAVQLTKFHLHKKPNAAAEPASPAVNADRIAIADLTVLAMRRVVAVPALPLVKYPLNPAAAQ